MNPGFPIVLRAFNCGENGVLTEIDPPDPLAGDDLHRDLSWVADAMPLILIPPITGPLKDAFLIFEQQANAITFVDTVTRPLGNVTFTEYTFTHTDPTLTAVYALTSGYLHYLPAGRSDPALLSGVAPDEDMLILKPLKTILDIYWKETHPGNQPLLGECVYASVSPISDNDLCSLIKRSTTEEFFKRIFKTKRGFEFQGTNWDAEYLKLFKEFPDVSILVRGGTQIASTQTIGQTQKITLFLKFPVDGQELWTGTNHAGAVRTFFKYFRRRGSGLCGHPLIAKIIGKSVWSGSVDVIGPQLPTFNFTDFSNIPPPPDPLFRTKSSLVRYFKNFGTMANPEFHPLALDPDEEPHRLIVPKAPVGPIPPYLVSRLGPDYWVARLKVYNPLGLKLQLVYDASRVNIYVGSSSETEQVLQFNATVDSPESTILTITNEESGEIITELNLTFLDFQAFPVKFWKLSDSNPNHITNMDEAKLQGIVAYANEMLGRQTNVYIYPVEVLGMILHDIVYVGDLNDPMLSADVDSVADDFYRMNQPRNIHMVFTWNEESIKDTVGLTTYSNDLTLALILLDTTVLGQSDDYAIVHEIGHWFSNIFIRVPNIDLPDLCVTAFKDFCHPQKQTAKDGCPGGAWSFYANFMAPAGVLFISYVQAKVFIDHASEVLM